MQRIWGIIRIKEKIARDVVAEFVEGGLDDALETLCLQLDIPRPVVLKKHRSEYLKFFRTRFMPEDFIEHVNFAAFEVELLREKKKENPREDYM